MDILSIFRRSRPYLKSVRKYTARHLLDIGSEAVDDLKKEMKTKDAFKRQPHKIIAKILNDIGRKFVWSYAHNNNKRKYKKPNKVKRKKYQKNKY